MFHRTNSIVDLLQLKKQTFVLLRGYKKSKKHSLKEITNIDRALEYFDSVYPQVYGTKWKLMKKALFSPPKYVALINNFTDTEEITKQFEELSAYDVGTFYTKQVKTFQEQQSINNLSSTTQEWEEEPKLNSSKIRPSSIVLTDEEKAEIASRPSVGRYPEEYRQKFLADEYENVEISDSSRLISSSNIDEIGTSSMHNYVPATKLKGLENWIEEADVLSDAKDSMHEIGVKKIKEKKPLQWPEYLKVYSFIKGDKESTFPAPKITNLSNHISTHYLLDGGSILPVLALDLQSQDKVLDVCSGPGGKSLAIIQTLLAGQLVCNDKSFGRLKRVNNVINEFIPQAMSAIRNSVVLSQNDGVFATNPDSYDKVLVDAPCLTDRHSLEESDNSIFKTTRIRERLRMPELQAHLIVSALKSVKPGGSVVYSTCTLSPLHNDGAVHLALTRIWRETKIECTVVDLELTMKNLNFMYRLGFDLGLRYGQIVLPSPGNNFGPTYFCKINRVR